MLAAGHLGDAAERFYVQFLQCKLLNDVAAFLSVDKPKCSIERIEDAILQARQLDLLKKEFIAVEALIYAREDYKMWL